MLAEAKGKFEEEAEELGVGSVRGMIVEVPEVYAIEAAEIARQTGMSVRVIRNLVRAEAEVAVRSGMRPVRAIVSEYLSKLLLGKGSEGEGS